MASTPPPTAVGPWLVPLRKLAEVLSESATFRVACGLAADDDEAAEKLIDGVGAARRIWYPTVELERVTTALPLAVIEPGGGWTWTQVAGGASNLLWPTRGNLILILADVDRAEGDLMAGMSLFGNFVGQTIAEIAELAAVDDRLATTAISEEIPPFIADQADVGAEGSWWRTLYRVSWGDG
jgi:hypothetical protein